MSEVQKIIKYLAIAFALFLAVSIISLIMNIIISIGGSINNDSSNFEKLDIEEGANAISINVKSVNIEIKTGEKLLVETDNEYINVQQDKNQLYITEKKHNLLKNNKDTLIVYVPRNMTFDDVIISSGAGKLKIDTLTTKDIYLELGAGSVLISNLDVLNSSKIDGGAGSIEIKNANINNMNLDLGVGRLDLSGIIKGNSKIDCGVGTININLTDSLNNYKIRLDKGIGTAIINNENMKDEIYYGSGSNIIDIDGGIGSIKLNTK